MTVDKRLTSDLLFLQHCPPGRFLLFATIGLALYVTGPAPMRRAWHRLLAMLPPMQVGCCQDCSCLMPALPTASR